jgi:hypothetical protein
MESLKPVTITHVHDPSNPNTSPFGPLDSMSDISTTDQKVFQSIANPKRFNIDLARKVPPEAAIPKKQTNVPPESFSFQDTSIESQSAARLQQQPPPFRGLGTENSAPPPSSLDFSVDDSFENDDQEEENGFGFPTNAPSQPSSVSLPPTDKGFLKGFADAAGGGMKTMFSALKGDLDKNQNQNAPSAQPPPNNNNYNCNNNNNYNNNYTNESEYAGNGYEDGYGEDTQQQQQQQQHQGFSPPRTNGSLPNEPQRNSGNNNGNGNEPQYDDTRARLQLERNAKSKEMRKKLLMVEYIKKRENGVSFPEGVITPDMSVEDLRFVIDECSKAHDNAVNRRRFKESILTPVGMVSGFTNMFFSEWIDLDGSDSPESLNFKEEVAGFLDSSDSLLDMIVSKPRRGPDRQLSKGEAITELSKNIGGVFIKTVFANSSTSILSKVGEKLIGPGKMFDTQKMARKKNAPEKKSDQPQTYATQETPQQTVDPFYVPPPPQPFQSGPSGFVLNQQDSNPYQNPNQHHPYQNPYRFEEMKNAWQTENPNPSPTPSPKPSPLTTTTTTANGKPPRNFVSLGLPAEGRWF